MKSKVFIVLYFILCCCIVCNEQEWKQNMYSSDVSGYYIYLPATFIYHDIDHLQFHTEVNRKYYPNDDDKWYLFTQPKTGKKLDQYAIGASLFELPTFLIAHLYYRVTHNDADDGYSSPYQLAGIFSTILWVIAGLFVLRTFLLNYFDDTTVFFTLLCVALGTNLYYYTAFSQGFSHPYSFYLFAHVLYFTDKWYKTKKKADLFLLAIGLGLVAITRPVNIIIVALPLLWQINNIKYCNAFNAIRSQTLNLVIALFLFISIISIQLIYWKYITGHWVYFSYEHQGFDFFHPKVLRGLFGYRKGWFVYTPIAFISLCGCYFLYKKNRSFFYSLFVFFILMIYIVFSWRNWWYGGGFGCRPQIESLAVAALPLASLLERVLYKTKLFLNAITFLMLFFCITLNMFQTYQYTLHIIHCDRMSKAYYWKTFGKLKINPDEYEKYLLDEKEYWREMREIDK